MQSQVLFSELRQLVANNDLDSVILRLHDLLDGSPLLDETILHAARHQDILRQIRQGTVSETQASQTFNQIRAGLLDLIRELETAWNASYSQPLNDFKIITEKIKVNRGAGTSSLLKNKTVADLDEKELQRLFEKERARRVFDEAGELPEDLSAREKLLHLSLAENGHIFKGTFLCLGKTNQINAVCHTATESKFIQFKGEDRSEILVLETLNGNLLRQYDKIMMLLRTHIPLGRDRSKSEDIYEIPIVAVREFVANAFVHRNYSEQVQSYVQVELYEDRLEIKSPGHLPKNLDVTKVEGTVLTNPVIAAVFHLYGHIERAGTGIRVAQKALQIQGLLPARIEDIHHPEMVKVTIFRNRHSAVEKKPGNFFNRLLESGKGLFLP